MNENRTSRVRKKKVDSDFCDSTNIVTKKSRKLNNRKLKNPGNATADGNGKAFGESNDTVLWEPPSVVLSLRDKASQIDVSADQLVCTGGEGGFQMIRATQGVHAGSYYYEVEILASLCEESHVRLGWSTREGQLQAFTGYDKSSFGIRDINGGLIHCSKRFDGYMTKNIVGVGFGRGDIIGCYIHLNDCDVSENHIRFYKNGVELGVAFTNNVNHENTNKYPLSATSNSNNNHYNGCLIPSAIYYPAISLYRQACVRVNFGPSFILKPTLMHGAMAMSEVQPMSPRSRKIHEMNIKGIQLAKKLQNFDTTNMDMRTPMVVLTKESCMDTKSAEFEES